ncbi:MAG: hypothetical protein HY315_08795 [Acidobacteria bacterium]|nr:hypothetical protein [Acidobacteriota bacterium]
MGRAIGGRKLRIIFQLKPKNIVRKRIELEEVAFVEAKRELAAKRGA